MKRVAAIDCGTNSIRLLISDIDTSTNTATDVCREMRIVRLGEGVDKTNAFSPRALERTFKAIDEYEEILLKHKVENLRFVATSATRDAQNKAMFIKGVIDRLRIVPEVIAGTEEAALSFDGATRSLRQKHKAPFLIIDLGGGSTELVIGDQEPTGAYSMDVGCVRMTERHTPGGNPTKAQEEAIRTDVRNALKEAAKKVDWQKAQTIVGVAGTVTTVAAHVLKLKTYDPEVLHGASISAQQISQTAQDFISLTPSQRAALPYMHEGRIEVITAGSIVLDEVMKAIGAQTLIASERDILDGVAWSQVQ
jgi:exopolyphosphatase/guanosine-5'-triphosphate,3'-diphosphate pyrophosphatase